MKTATVRVYEALIDIAGDGPAGDGTKTVRFRKREDLERYVAGATCYGGPVRIHENDVPRKLAQRWGLA